MRVIEFYEQELERQTFVNKSQFEFSPEKGWVILQRLCFWVLGKIKAHVQTNTVKVNRFKFCGNDFMEKLYRMDEKIYRYMTRMNEISDKYVATGNKHLLIGPKTFQEFVSEAEVRHLLTIESSFHVGYNGRREIMGFKITIIPWMEGMIALPEDFQGPVVRVKE